MRLLGMVLCFFVSLTTFADGFFENHRHDRNTPADCLETEIDDFLPAGELQYFTVGIKGAKKKGYTFEYPITRDQASRLWKPAKRFVEKGKEAEEIELPEVDEFSGAALPIDIGQGLEKTKPEEIVKNLAEEMDFTLGNEGEVLELLASLAMERALDPEKYFVSGSVAYHDEHVKRTIGELDLVVGERDTCTIIAVGEVKLGLRNKAKAMGQLERFHNFLKLVTDDRKAKFHYSEPIFEDEDEKDESEKKAS